MNRRSRTSRSLRRALLVLLAGAILVTVSSCDLAGQAATSAILINRERSARSIPGLAWDDELARKATAWAERMAATSTLMHSRLSDGVGGYWTVLGENVGWGDDIATVHDRFMGSPVHRDDILNRSFRAVGVGVAEAGGRIWVAQVFKG